jgi:hypothetical protein
LVVGRPADLVVGRFAFSPARGAAFFLLVVMVLVAFL